MRSKLVVSMACLIGIHVLAIAGCGAEPDAGAVDAGGGEPDGAIDIPDGGTARDSGGFDIDVERPSHYEPASSLEEGCAQRADAMCAITAACTPLGFVWMFGGIEHCRESYANECLSSVHAEGSRWQANELTACANDYAGMSCERLHFGHAWETCSALAGGPRKPGESCIADSQCESNECAKDHTGCGSCKGGLGAPCEPGSFTCITGLVCEDGDDGARCDAPPEIGEECDRYCSGWARCEMGRCVKPVPAGLGEPCKPTSVFACDEHAGLNCDSKTSTCQPMRFAAVGEICGAPSGVACTGEAFCDTVTKRCVRRAKPGEACEATICYRGFECIDGTCQRPEPLSCP